MTTLKLNSRGDEVIVLQKLLGLTPDGIFGNNTKTAVINFQRAHNLTADGIVGPKTWEALGIVCDCDCHTTNPTPGPETNPEKVSDVIILIDNGHGVNTPGKQSPDGTLREYKWARDIAIMVEASLKAQGYDARRIVTEDIDISLTERCNRANAIYNTHPRTILVSIHSNAAGGDGKWKSAGGWCVYTSPGQTKSDILATDLWNAADRILQPYKDQFYILQSQGHYDSKQKPMRADWSDGDPDYEANFTILTKTKCPAVLTESLFQDNKKDVEFLLSALGREVITELHVEGIKKFIKDNY